MWIEIVRKYCSEETRDGVQKSDQRNREQREGRKNIQLKVRKCLVHISPSDKVKGLVVTDRDTYDKMAFVHT